MASDCGVIFVLSCLVPCSCVCSVLSGFVITSLWEEGADRLASPSVICLRNNCSYSFGISLGITERLRVLSEALSELHYFSPEFILNILCKKAKLYSTRHQIVNAWVFSFEKDYYCIYISNLHTHT